MPFLNSILLWGTMLGSVPIIIHLLNKRRYRPVTWAAMEFLLQAIQKNARRLQLRDIILMLIRTAAIVCLALALARPTISARSVLGGTKTAAIILLDNSLSMGYHNGNQTRFEYAKRLIKNPILPQLQLESGAWCALLTFNSDTKAPLGDPSQNLTFIEQELDNSVQLSDGTTNIEKALQKAKQIIDRHPEYQLANREIYILTDMQSRAWNTREVSANFAPLLKDLSAKAAIYLINAGDAGGTNVAVLDLAPADTLVSTDTNVTFVAKIRNFGQNELKSYPVDFFVDPKGSDDKPAQHTTIDISAGETTSVTFETKFATGGDHKVSVRLTGDRLAADDNRACSIEVIDETHVLLVDGKDQRSDDPLATETGFLRFALSPRDPENPEKQNVIATEIVPHFRMSDKNLQNYQAVALANVARVPQPVVALLERQVRSGMGLMIFCGENLDAQAYNAALGESGAKLLPAKIAAAWGQAPSADADRLPPAISFATDKLSHPLMVDFNDPDGGHQMLSSVSFYKGYELEVPANDDSVRVAAHFANGKPAIVEKKVGSGYVMLFAFPATTAWSNLPTQYAFTILALRAAQMLTLGNRLPKNVTVGAPLRTMLPLSDQNTTIRISPPPPSAKKDTRPELTSDGRAQFEFSETERAGIYDVLLERTPPASMVFAVNPDTEVESNLDTALPERLRQDYPGFEFSYVAQSADLSSRLLSERRGSELWIWLIGMVFLLLAAESILAYRWAPRD